MSMPEASDGEAARLAALERYEVLDTPPEEAFDRVARLAQRLFDAPIAGVSLLDERRAWPKSAYGLPRRAVPREMTFCTVAIGRDEVFVVNDASADPRFSDNPCVAGPPHIRFYAGAQLRTPDGHAIGTLCLMDYAPRDFGEDDRAALADLARIVADELELRLLANVDALTGALSRRAFRETAERALALARRHRHDLSLIALDLDRFKEINDGCGHACGDAVLARSVAVFLRELRASDAIGRLGGEEFAVLLPHAGPKAALEIAERLRAGLAAERFASDDVAFGVTASLGVASLRRATADADELFRNADAALYDAKAAGRDRVAAWRPAEGEVEASGRRVFKGGLILFNRRLSSMECTVRTQSETGAGLDVANAAGLPDRFELRIGADRTLLACRVLTLTTRRVEVAFE